MAQFLYDSSYNPSAPVMTIGIGLPDEENPRQQVQALIDTGADATMVAKWILTEIGARSVGRKFLRGVTGNRELVGIYLVVIHMPTGISYGIRAVATDGSNEVILGRDVLNQWRITLDGPGEIVEIAP